MDELRRLRHILAAATERLRGLDLPPGDASTARDVACAVSGALSTILFVGSEAAGPENLVGLIEGEIRQVAGLLGIDLAPTAEHQVGCVCLTGGLPPERTLVWP